MFKKMNISNVYKHTQTDNFNQHMFEKIKTIMQDKYKRHDRDNGCNIHKNGKVP